MRIELLAAVLAVLLVTLPFGFYRAYTRKLSLSWFFAIHAPVPLVFLIRAEAHLSYAFIPLTCLAFAAAQILGSRLGRRRIKRRQTPSATAEDSRRESN